MSEWATTTRFETNWHQYWYEHAWTPELILMMATDRANGGGEFFGVSHARMLDYERYYKERRERETRIRSDGSARTSGH